jgi:hypothetical protein
MLCYKRLQNSQLNVQEQDRYVMVVPGAATSVESATAAVVSKDRKAVQ